MHTTQTVTPNKLSSKSPKRKLTLVNKTPLVQVDRDELGDKRLDPKEGNAKIREELLAQEAKKKIWGQDELEDPDRALGSRMPLTELLRKLQQCNPGIRVKDGKPGNVALYFRKRSDEYTEVDKIILTSPSTARAMNIPVPADSFFIHHKYVGGFEKNPMPEYAYVDIDSSHLATKEHRGWRSVLIGLIKVRAISYASAIEVFGDPALDTRSKRWFVQLQKYRS